MIEDLRYDPTLKVAEGMDYILRVGERYPMIVLGRCLYSYRFKIGSLSRQDAAARSEMVRKVIRQACQRQGCDVSERFFYYEPAESGAFGHRGRENNIVAHFMQSVIDLRGAGRSGEALRTALSCAKLHPFDLYYYKPFLYTVVPLSVIDLYRSAKDKFSAILKIGPAA